MVKIDIVNRTNLTFLAKAFLENLFPRGKRHQVFYDHDSKGEIKFIYFADIEYYHTLIIVMNEKLLAFKSSNSADEWTELYETMRNHEIIENVDYGKLYLYDITENSENSLEIDTDFTQNNVSKNDSFLKNVKRIYPGQDITYESHDNYAIIKLNLDPKDVFRFNLKPIIELIDFLDSKLKNFSIYRDPQRNYTSIKIEI